MRIKLLSTCVLIGSSILAIPALADFTISAGIQSTTMDVHSNMNVTEPPGMGDPDSFPINGFEDDFDTDVSGELAVGYQYDFDDTYNIALELYGQLLAPQVVVPFYAGDNNDFSNDAVHTSFDWITGLRLRPGYYVTPSTRFFIDGGVALGNFKAEYPNELTFSDDRGITVFPTHSSETSTLWGWRYGVGIEHEIDENFLIGVDYTITQFNEMNATVVSDTLLDPSLGFEQASMMYTPKLSTLGLNFKYLFDSE